MKNQQLVRGSTSMLILKLISEKDMYGYEMIDELEKRSENIFSLQAGTLYPLLHGLEASGHIESYKERAENQRMRKYYRITKEGRKRLEAEKKEWEVYIHAIGRVMKRGVRSE